MQREADQGAGDRRVRRKAAQGLGDGRFDGGLDVGIMVGGRDRGALGQRGQAGALDRQRDRAGDVDDDGAGILGGGLPDLGGVGGHGPGRRLPAGQRVHAGERRDGPPAVMADQGGQGQVAGLLPAATAGARGPGASASARTGTSRRAPASASRAACSLPVPAANAPSAAAAAGSADPSSSRNRSATPRIPPCGIPLAWTEPRSGSTPGAPALLTAFSGSATGPTVAAAGRPGGRARGRPWPRRRVPEDTLAPCYDQVGRSS